MNLPNSGWFWVPENPITHYFLTISFSIFFQLDYFSAFSIVVYSLLAFFLRILGSWRSSKGIKWSNFAAILGKKHALKTYDQFILNASCFWGSIESNISPQLTMASIIVEVKISWKKFQQQNFPEIRNLKTATVVPHLTWLRFFLKHHVRWNSRYGSPVEKFHTTWL